MALSPILDQARPSFMWRWDTGSLAWVVWDGSLTTGALTIGKVDQGTAGASAWLVTRAGLSSATLTNVNDTASNVTLLSSNASRKGVTCQNDSTQVLFLKYGTTATATSYTVKIPAGGYWEMPEPVYTGQIDGIWAADASGAARMTEW